MEFSQHCVIYDCKIEIKRKRKTRIFIHLACMFFPLGNLFLLCLYLLIRVILILNFSFKGIAYLIWFRDDCERWCISSFICRPTCKSHIIGKHCSLYMCHCLLEEFREPWQVHEKECCFSSHGMGASVSAINLNRILGMWLCKIVKLLFWKMKCVNMKIQCNRAYISLL